MTAQVLETRPTLHVVVSCKSRKTRPVRAELRIANVPSVPLDERVQTWIRLLEASDDESVIAGDLYAGEHWKIVRSLASGVRDDLSIKVWIVSAGYGLVEYSTRMKPYAATFIRSHVDSVVSKHATHAASDWWAAISEWSPQAGMPRQIRTLAETMGKGDFILLALSEPYAVAVANDIVAAARARPERVALISAGLLTSRSPELSEQLRNVLLPAESRLKSLVGGAMQGVNARIAAKAAADHALWFPNSTSLRQLLRSWLTQTPPLQQYHRHALSDDEVRSFISTHCSGAGGQSKSRLLRALRDAGMACEQSRFSALYQQVLEKDPIKGASVSPGVLA